MLAPFVGDAPAFVDAWEAVHPGQPHPPSWGLHERSHPLMCCDFVFAAGDVVAGLREVTVDPISQASDHQPVLVRWE
jgi:endonuclease/exonuclease/phosphatase family metal-dependent hydrolase